MPKKVNGIKTQLSAFLDVDYLIRFLVLLVGLYYFNLFYIAIIDPNGKIYIPFLDHYFNYINWMRNSLLYTANSIAHLLGTNSIVELPFKLTVARGAYVELVYACLGIGLMSFWIAYITAHITTVKSKIFWCLFGVTIIWLINSFRIAILLIALQKRWQVNRYIDHHTIFNICAYTVVFILVYLYARDSKKAEAGLSVV